MEFPIQPMKYADLDQVLALAGQLGYPCDKLAFEQRFHHLIGLSHHALFVYRGDHQIVGWIHLEIVSDLIEKTMLEIKAIVVDEGQRGKGIGHQLIEYSKIWAREQGLNAIFLSCNILRNKTHVFYEREGFRLDRTSHFFQINL